MTASRKQPSNILDWDRECRPAHSKISAARLIGARPFSIDVKRRLLGEPPTWMRGHNPGIRRLASSRTVQCRSTFFRDDVDEVGRLNYGVTTVSRLLSSRDPRRVFDPAAVNVFGSANVRAGYVFPAVDTQSSASVRLIPRCPCAAPAPAVMLFPTDRSRARPTQPRMG